MPDISTINSVDIATIASFNGVALADGQTLEGQNVALGGDAHTFISTTGAITSGVSNVEISGFNSTYDIYELHFINIKSPYQNSFFRFIPKVGTTYPATTSVAFYAFHAATSSGIYSFYTDSGLTNSASYIQFSGGIGNVPDSDESTQAILRLYSPSNTTYGKLFESVSTSYHTNDGLQHYFSQGVFNTTSAITSIQFYLYGGIDDGEIRLYGIKK